MMFAGWGEIWQKPVHCFIWFVLEMTADSSSLQDFLQCMALTRVASEKLNVCLSSNMWEKRAF